MKKIVVTLVTVLVSLNLSAQTKIYEGAWFSAEYPESYSAKGSLQSKTDEQGFDSALFTSPDGEVEFYVFAPQWGGNPTDIAVKENEKKGDTEETTSNHKIIKSWTIAAKDGSYQRSYQETTHEFEEGIKVIGIKYKSKAAYENCKSDYLAFKKSIQHFAD